MNVLLILVPSALVLGGVALLGFFWALRHDQFDDPSGHAARILSDRYDEHPAEDDAPGGDSAENRRNPLDAPGGAA